MGAAALLILVPGGVVAWQALAGAGPQPHDVLPASSIGYVRLDLDPSATQKVEAFRFLQKFPAFSESTGITSDDDDLRERLLDEFAESTGCDIAFDDDVEPWIGDRVGAAMTPPDGDSDAPGLVIAIQVDDEEAAEEGIDQILDCGGEAPPIGRAYLDGYVVLTETQRDADRYVEDARDSPLSDNEEFAEAMDLLGEQGIASLWFSGQGMVDAFGDQVAPDASDEFGQRFDGPDSFTNASTSPSVPSPDELVDDAYRSVAVAFRFDASYAEIASVVTGDLYESSSADGVRADVPDDSTMLLGFAGGNEYLRDTWDTLVETYPATANDIDEFARQTGLSLPEDLATMLGDSVTLVGDGHDLDVDDVMSGRDLSSLRIGARIVTNPDAFDDVWSSVEKAAAREGGSLDDLSLQHTEDGVVIASSDDYADELAGGGSLGDSDIYTTAVKGADDAAAVFFINLDTIEDQVRDALHDERLSDDLVDSVEAMRGLGYSVHVNNSYAEMTLRLTAD